MTNQQDPILTSLAAGQEAFWLNPGKVSFRDCRDTLDFTAEDVQDAADRLDRFAPVIQHYFPETAVTGGIIESPLTEIPRTQKLLEKACGAKHSGRLLLKQDSHLAVSGSVKARGGIYEVLKHTEALALEAGILTSREDDYLKLTTAEARHFFAAHKIQVGSTGNLGLSIGIMAAALGFEAIVHMSADAKQWKKDLLRQRGATVREYAGDYALAVKAGREESLQDPSSYFVDDEHSRDLFCGYAVAAQRLKKQLADLKIRVGEKHPLYVYIPCGVGGAPGGITFGLKLIYGDNVHVFFAEPTQAPCMLAGLASGQGNQVCVQDFGLSGKTEADGLAVGRCSGLVARNMAPLVDGEATIEDAHLLTYLQALWSSEQIFIEPSACAGFQPYIMHTMTSEPETAAHIIWATGGSMMPQAERDALLHRS